MSHRILTATAALCYALWLLPSNGHAQQQAHPADAAHPLHHHHLSFFSGGTTLLDGGSEVFNNQNSWLTMGIDYEYRINRTWGVSVFTEYLFAAHEEFLFGLPLFVHPYRGLKLNAAPLLALAHVGKDSETHTDGHQTWHSKYGFRLEAAYDFLFDRYTITPTLNFDEVDGHPEINYGIAIGLGL